MKFLMLLPECFWILILVGTGLAIILQLISLRTAAGIIGGIILMAILGPFMDGIFASLPAWLSLLIMIMFCVTILRWGTEMMFGKCVATHLLALLLHDVILLPFKMIGAIFKSARR